jgi:E3 ubiquitin-protein ligase ATL41
MDRSATNPAEARRIARMCEGTSLPIAYVIVLSVAYLFFGPWVTAAIVGAIFLSYLCTPDGRDHVCFILFYGRRPRPAASGGGGGGGMDEAAIAALPPAFAFKRDVLAGEGWAQCAICLGLVREGETVRRLPACGHLFHSSCVDEWLRAHATCPLCRAAVRAAARPPV